LLAGYRKFILVYLRQLLRARLYARATREALMFFSSSAILRTSRFVDGRRYLFRTLPEVNQLWPANLPHRPTALGIGNSLGRRIEADLAQFSLPVLLRYEDRNTMAFGVESRVPFVDHIFVEWLATLPVDLRLSEGWTKRILRDALAGILPERVRRRKSKLGFLTPESKWLAGPLYGWLNETLSAPRFLNDLVEPKGVRQLLDRFVAGEQSLPLQNVLFRLAIYESWARQFLAAGVISPRRDRHHHEVVFA
jgi:asparagine synthase (glutamine-hydrolysing)